MKKIIGFCIMSWYMLPICTIGNKCCPHQFKFFLNFLQLFFWWWVSTSDVHKYLRTSMGSPDQQFKAVLPGLQRGRFCSYFLKYVMFHTLPSHECAVTGDITQKAEIAWLLAVSRLCWCWVQKRLSHKMTWWHIIHKRKKAELAKDLI